MHSTLTPNQTDPQHVLASRVDEKLAHTLEEIARTDEQIARAEEQLSNLEHNAARRGNRPLLGGRAIRGLTGFTLTACICVAAFVWQSPSYGNLARQIIARWAPQLVPTSSLTLESLPAQQGRSTDLAATAKTAPPLPTPLVQPEIVAPTAAALSPDLTQLLQSMARDVAAMGQSIEQIKASQERMARDHVNAVDLLRASQEQMARVIAKTSEGKTSEARTSEQNARPRASAPPPRPVAAPARKPVPTL